MDRETKRWLAVVATLLVVAVATVTVVLLVQQHQRQESIDRIGREMGDRLAWDMTH